MVGLTRSLAFARSGPKFAVGGLDVGAGHDFVAPWSEHVVARRAVGEVARSGPKFAVGGLDVGAGHDFVAPRSEHVVARRALGEVAP